VPVDTAADHDRATAAGEIDAEPPFDFAVGDSPKRDERRGFFRNAKSHD
jgi:hypothetical protein